MEMRKYLNEDLKGIGGKLRAYIKGLKILLKNEYLPRAFEQMANAYKGECTPDLDERFRKIVRSFHGRDAIMQIGLGAKYSITDYVDGSFEGSLR
jgi:hypothetical protein